MADGRFERELERLRKEMELASATGSSSSTTSGLSPSAPGTPFVPTGESSGALGLDASPLVLPGTDSQVDVPSLALDQAEDQSKRQDESGRRKTS